MSVEPQTPMSSPLPELPLKWGGVHTETPLGSQPNPVPLRDRIGAQEPIRLGGHMPDAPDARDHLLEDRNALARRGEFLKAQLDARDATIATLNAQLDEAAREVTGYIRQLADLRAEAAQRDARASDGAPKPAAQWAIVEAMGHRTLAGKLTEVTIAGVAMLSVLRMDGRTQYLPPSSVYMITPCTLQEATAVARRNLTWSGLPNGMLAIGPPDDAAEDAWRQAGIDSTPEMDDNSDLEDLDDDQDPAESGGPF